MRALAILFATILICSCSNEPDRIIPEVTTFVKKSATHTGIAFNNIINETQTNNHYLWPSIYNGSGVGIADLNNDGLDDIVFTRTFGTDALYLNKGDFQFEDVTTTAGIAGDVEHISAGVSFTDVNQDGYKDIYLSVFGYSDNPDHRRNKLFINNGDMTFTDKAKEYGIDNAGCTVQSAFFDYDRDGDDDLFVMNQPSNERQQRQAQVANRDKEHLMINEMTSDRLYRNDGGKFVDVSEEAGIENFSFGLGLVIHDINKDGYLDIYVANDYEKPDLMYINNQKGGFADETNNATNHISIFAMGTDISDINNDGLVDIGILDMAGADHYRSKTNMQLMSPSAFYELIDRGFQYQYMHNTLQLNNGNNTFSDIAYLAGVAKTDWSWSLVMADFDNDQHKDIYVTNGIKKDIRNNDFSTIYRARIDSSENGYSATPLELLNLIPSTPMSNYFYHNDGDLHFSNKSDEWGLGEKGFSNGCAFADLDNDGDLDLVVNNVSALASVYENQVSRANNYLRIDPESKNHRSVTGTKAIVYTPDGVSQYAELSTVRGFISSSEDVIHFGLGDNKKVDKVEIIWPDGTYTVLDNPKVNKEHKIVYEEAKRSPYVYDTQNDTYIAVANTLDHKHVENDFYDFDVQILLPYMPSRLGPFMSTADANGDGIVDLYIGGAKGQSGMLYLRDKTGAFSKASTPALEADKSYEDMGSVWFDVDSDGDLDLYVASGGYEFDKSSSMLADRLYLNDGTGNLNRAKSAIPMIKQSTQKVISADFNGDGLADVASFGRVVPSMYPKSPDSYLLINEGGKLADQTGLLAPDMKSLGMITGAEAVDYDQDGDIDILVAGEWTKILAFRNDGGKFTKTELAGIEDSGLYSHLNVEDVDGDGDLDIIAGNIGKNIKWKASKEKPFKLYADDFDNNGGYDIVLANYSEDKLVPVRGKECSTQQIPFVSEKFETYDGFASATLDKIYDLEGAQDLYVTDMKNAIYINDGSQNYKKVALPTIAQVSPINASAVLDINKDGHLDIVAVGNQFDMEVETTRLDASAGYVLLGDSKGNFSYVAPGKSGLNARRNAKDMVILDNTIIVSNNNDQVDCFKIK